MLRYFYLFAAEKMSGCSHPWTQSREGRGGGEEWNIEGGKDSKIAAKVENVAEEAGK